MMLFTPALSTPEKVLAVMQPPMSGGFLFFVIFNMSMEWLCLPVSLWANWKVSARRNPLVIAAILFYAGRVWSYTFFIPRIMTEFMPLPPGQPLTDKAAADLVQWVQLSWVRCALDGIACVLILYALSLRVQPNSNSAKSKDK
eukprot:TRINITY_DN5702_c0_g1_i1.p1 TRINITY_DN5702_c0_g1~~TRINITY_DN5702_c0_g1_i1.p1  ORF type:complete len:143 (+),score=24.68 TRINITY_DN5702_c0_g1_i1:65-493(+)